MTLRETFAPVGAVFSNRRVAMLLLLGFSSGLPLALTGSTLQAWMTEEGVELKTIGFFALVGLPYTWKFLWSPAMDRFVMPFLGRRRGWIAVLQLLLGGAIAVMAGSEPRAHPAVLAALAFAVTFLSASQDIVIDAYRTDVLREKELGAGAAVSVLGYRLAMLTSGAIALILADRLPWRTVYLIMAGLMAAGVAATLWAPEPEVHPPAPRTLGDAVVKPLRDFLSRPGAAEVLAFIVLFKFGDALAGQMFTPFLLHTGFSKTEIGAIQKGIGFVATITGMLFGGGLMARLGLRRSLVTFGLLQAAALLSFVALALIGKSDAALIAAISIDNVAGGMGTAAFVAFLMSQCDKRFTATQYALLSALAATPRVVLVSPAGILAEALGWPLFFFGCVLAAVPALLLLLRFPRWRGPQPVPT